jgi:thiol-disulfide isomerase/thioredoxin
MIRLRFIIRNLAALICLGAAFLLLARSGLPDKIELYARSGAQGTGAALEIGSPAPPFQLLSTSGEQVTIDSSAGMVTLINFWATYCGPCRQELRDLQRLQDSRPDSIRILAVNMGESAALVADWQSELGIRYDLLLDPALAVSQKYLVRGIPTSYLLDSSQRIRQVYYGPVTLGQLENDIQRLAQRV